MLKYVKKYIDNEAIKIAFVFALLHLLLFNSASFIYKFYYISPNIVTAILELVKDFIYNMMMLFIVFLGLMVHRLLFIPGAVTLFIISSITSYYLLFFSISPSLSLMPSIFGTHATEVYELLSIKIIIWVIFSISICIYTAAHFRIQSTKSFFTRILAATCLLITINNIITPKFSFLKTAFPIQYLHNGYVYFFGNKEKYTRIDLNTKFSFEDLSAEDVIGVLVIGESARYGNFGINGYERDTTPNLVKLENLVSYMARSCANHTYISVPCMLSRYGEKDVNLIDTETSFLSVLTKLNFETLLIGTQSIRKEYKNRTIGSFYDEVNFNMIPGGSALMLPNSHDEKMLPYLEQNLAIKGKKFIILHTTGSHWNYSGRYPKEFEKFTPALNNGNSRVDAASCNETERLNSYDNSILYTDFFLSEVISRLKDKKAFVIYSSDHGESFGEGGRISHGHDVDAQEQRTVPFMIWFSDSYKAAYPEKWESVKAMQKEFISHDYIFHTVLDCLNIKSDAIDQSLSLCHTNKPQ